MKRTALIFVVFFFAFGTASAQSKITVLLLTGSGVSPSTALSAIPQLNALMVNSGLNSYVFENAGVNYAAPNLTIPSMCIGTDPEALVSCAMAQHLDDRDNYDADIVLLVVPSISVAKCGGVSNSMINANDISNSNQHLAYAAVGAACAWPGFLASHEVLHLLSIEHKNGDPELNKPVRDNHGWAQSGQATAGASPADCSGGCSAVYNEMSDPDENFPVTTFPKGSNLHANAKRIVKDISWDVVAAYRPVLTVQACNPIFEFRYCNGDAGVYALTAELPGYSVSSIDVDIQVGGTGPWIDIYEGSNTCPSTNITFWSLARMILYTAYGTSECTVYVPAPNCGGPFGW